MDIELDLRQLFRILLRKWWLILFLLIISGGGAYAISRYVIVPMYSASVSMYVYNEESRSSDAITSSDLATSQKLVSTYIVILTSNSVLDSVSRELGGKYSTRQIREMLAASSINDTEAFRITITHQSPSTAQLIANTIAQVAPEEIIRVVKAGAVEVIDYASLPVEPSSPNIPRNTALGALIGLVLAMLIAVLAAMADTAVRSEEDLTAAFTLPVLGVIPSLAERGKGVHKG